ncbi:hypothetical protein [Kitasatospora sp. NPDC058190]|uniref:hypothetical protein n=1 Tax=Kitasatospora sp. NPDC058190 TaxID=3346371 RepID=UPI0036DACFDA
MIIDTPLGDGQEPGDVAGLEVVGNDGFLAAVMGGEFTVHHRSTETLLAAPGERRPPGEGEPTWERVREVTGVEVARLISTDRELFVESRDGLTPRGRPAAVINFAGDCVFRPVGDEAWYRGFLDRSTGDITFMLTLGPGLEPALQRLMGR